MLFEGSINQYFIPWSFWVPEQLLCLKHWWLVLSLFPLISPSWKLTAESSSTDFQLVGAPFLGKSRFPFELNASYPSCKALEGTLQKPWNFDVDFSQFGPFLEIGWIPFCKWCAWKGFWSPSFYSISFALLEVPWFFSSGIDPEAIICSYHCLLDPRNLTWTGPPSFPVPFWNKHALFLDHLLSCLRPI